MASILKNSKFSLVVIAAMVGAGLYLMPQLPEAVPSHWNIYGQIDGYSSKEFAVWFLPTVALMMSLLLGAMDKLAPSKFQTRDGRRAMESISLATTVLFASMHVGMLLMALNPHKYRFETFFGVGMGVFLLITGHFMSKLEVNYLAGVRVPWTLASERNWRATHRFASRSMVIGGLILLPLTAVRASMILSIVIVLVSCLMPAAYSYYYFVKYENKKHL